MQKYNVSSMIPNLGFKDICIICSSTNKSEILRKMDLRHISVKWLAKNTYSQMLGVCDFFSEMDYPPS